MSRDSSDDDIPGLASVSGSEGSDEESDDGFLSGTEDEDPSQGHVFNTGLWLMFEASTLSQHVEVFRVYVLSPFLYGHAHQSDRWLKWCHQVGLLHSDIEFNLEALSDKELMAVEILLTTVSYIGKSMVGPPSDVTKLLQVMEQVEVQETPVLAARTARKWKWFIILIDKIRESAEEIGITKDSFQSKRFFVEITCLFVMNQAVDHINKILKGNADYHTDFQKMRAVHEESGEQIKEEGDDYERNGNYELAIETYTTAMICCPYYQQLYISRAYAYMKLSMYRAAVADGMRAVCLNPSNPKAHICYIRALKIAGFKDRSAVAIKDFNRKFPEEQNELFEQSFADQAREKCEERKRDIIDRKPTEKDQVLNEKIMGTCKQASEAYLAGNLDEAVFYYQEAVNTSEESEGWQACWVFSDCEQFLVSLYYAFGMALLSKGSSEDASKALSQFNFIITNHLFNFPPAHYGVGRSLVLLHNHTEAGNHAKKGLELLASYRIIQLKWPGTTQYMTECMPHYIEPKLQQIIQQCEPMQVADAICRYPGCLQHHTSSDIVFHQDYKGHVRMQCSDGCNIAYHPACWRRFKSDSVLGADKDFLGTMCKTPDCEGEIRNVYIYDTKGGLKKVEGDPNVKKATHTTLPTPAALARESKRSSHWKKKSVGEAVESVPKGGGAQEEVFIGKAESVMVEEDSRREEAAVITINRQAEMEDEERDGNGGKSKVKKKLQREMEKLEKMKLSSVQWNDLFSHPEREGLVQEENASIISKWEPDPAHPFLPPDHLREKIEEFEMKESPSIGLPSRLLGGGGTAVTPISEDTPGPPSSEVIGDEDMEFFVSYFGEIVRAHGPLASSDPQILESLNFLPEDRKVKIEKAGGIAKLLVDSGRFVMQGKLVCPTEEVGVVAESMNANSASRSQSSEEGIGNDSEKQSDRGDARSDNSITTPSPFAQKSALSGLLSSSHMKTDLQSLADDLNRERGWVRVKSNKSKQQEVGSKRNTSALDPKTTDSPNSAVQERKSMKSPSVNKKAEDVLRKAQIRRDKDLVFPDEERRIGAKDTERKGSMLGVRDIGASVATRKMLNKDSSSSDEKRKGSSGSSDEKGKKLDAGTARKKKSKLEDFPAEPNRNSNRNSSKETFNSLEKSRQGQESNESPSTERRDLFSPTNSTSSVSSESSSGVATPAATKKSSKIKKAKNNNLAGLPEATTNAKSATPTTTTTTTKVQYQSAMVQTEPTLTKDKWVMTEGFVPVESFKERYEGVSREKKDLQEKLERSEDQRFKLQKTHKRELEQLQRQTKQEAKEAAQSRLSEVEGKLKSEGAKVENVRKESTDQLRLAKAEIKSLTDKIERLKKDVTRKDSHFETKSRQLRTEIEQLHDDKHHYSDRLKVSKEAETKAVVRATNAEVEVLNMRSDLVLKPWEVKMREIEAVCMTVPQGSELQRECMVYRDKMKSALDVYQVAVEDQMRQVKAGCDLSSMERIPSPVVHIPPQLGMMMMRPGFFPMMPMSRAPFGMGGMVRPQQMGGLPPMAPYQAQPEPELHSHPPTLPLGEAEPAPHAAASPSEIDLMNGGGGGKKSSFDRIVEKLGPTYPQYNKEDFKAFLREVRRSNKNTLSGLSLDTIAQQVKGIIEQREKKTTGGRGGGGSTAKGKTSSSSSSSSNRSRQPAAEKKGKQKSRLPPVATAPPPVTSSADYDENACIICYEDMRMGDSSKLDCGHRFHSKCIRSWFREQSTCPTCRNHSLLVEEYPTLK